MCWLAGRREEGVKKLLLDGDGWRWVACRHAGWVL